MGQHHVKTTTQTPIAADTRPAVGQPLSVRPKSALLAEVLKEATKKHYNKAISLSSKQGGQDLDIINARGVCLMRIGKYDEAVALFRKLVLEPGCTWMRRDRPAHDKCNFATALLLSRHPSGCLDVLHELGAEARPLAASLRAAIKRWESGLSFWSWLDWKFNRVDPNNSMFAIDFEPCEFAGDSALVDATSTKSLTTPLRNAA